MDHYESNEGWVLREDSGRGCCCDNEGDAENIVLISSCRRSADAGGGRKKRTCLMGEKGAGVLCSGLPVWSGVGVRSSKACKSERR